MSYNFLIIKYTNRLGNGMMRFDNFYITSHILIELNKLPAKRTSPYRESFFVGSLSWPLTSNKSSLFCGHGYLLSSSPTQPSSSQLMTNTCGPPQRPSSRKRMWSQSSIVSAQRRRNLPEIFHNKGLARTFYKCGSTFAVFLKVSVIIH